MGILRDLASGLSQQGGGSSNYNSSSNNGGLIRGTIGGLAQGRNNGYGNSNNNYNNNQRWCDNEQYQNNNPPPSRYNNNSSYINSDNSRYNSSRNEYDDADVKESQRYSSPASSSSPQPPSYYNEPPALPPRQKYNTSPYQQQQYNNSSMGARLGLPVSMNDGPLQRPFALPQTGNGSATPFLRGYSQELEAAGIHKRDLIQFIDILNTAIVPNPEMAIINKATGIAGWFVPGAGGIALSVAQIGAQVGGAVQGKSAVSQCLNSANQNLFYPIGLEAKICSTQDLNNMVGFIGGGSSGFNYQNQGGYQQGGYVQQQNPMMAHLQQLDGAICHIDSVLPVIQSGRTDPMASVGGWLQNRGDAKAARKAAEDAAKGKMKKADKLEASFQWLVIVNSSQGLGGYGAGTSLSGGYRTSNTGY